MPIRALNNICFTICIVCIVAGTALSLFMIWIDVSAMESLWKLWLTTGVLFLASALTMGVTKNLTPPPPSPGPPPPIPGE